MALRATLKVLAGLCFSLEARGGGVGEGEESAFLPFQLLETPAFSLARGPFLQLRGASAQPPSSQL